MTLARVEQLVEKDDPKLAALRKSPGAIAGVILTAWQDPATRQEFHGDITLLDAYVRLDLLRRHERRLR